MENASKALIIAGAILISILIIAIGMFIYNSSQGTIDRAMSSMGTQEIESLNKSWTSYEGKQSGSQVKGLINKLIANANNYREEPQKIVGITSYEATNGVTVNATNFVVNDSTGDTEIDTLIANLNTAYTAIQPKHNYTVTMNYHSSGLITGVTIDY